MAWEKINEMFPYGGFNLQGKWLSNEEIIAKDLPYVTVKFTKPIRKTTQNVARYIWNADGSMQQYYVYNIYPKDHIDNIPVFNVYGQYVYNKNQGRAI